MKKTRTLISIMFLFTILCTVVACDGNRTSDAETSQESTAAVAETSQELSGESMSEEAVAEEAADEYDYEIMEAGILADIAKACDAEDYETAWSLMFSDAFESIRIELQQTGADRRIVQTPSGKLGVYHTFNEGQGAIGEYFIYFGDYVGDKREGTGVWLRVGHNEVLNADNGYRVEVPWKNDLPNGEFLITNPLMNVETASTSYKRGTAVDGFFDGTVQSELIFGDIGKSISDSTFVNGYYAPLEFAEYIWNDGEGLDQLELYWEEYEEPGDSGITGAWYYRLNSNSDIILPETWRDYRIGFIEGFAQPEGEASAVSGGETPEKTESDLTKEDILTLYEETKKKDAEIETWFQTEATGMMPMREKASERAELWETFLNTLLAYLEATLPENEWDALSKEQEQWKEEADAVSEAQASQYEGGTAYPLELSLSYTNEMIDRAEVLMQRVR